MALPDSPADDVFLPGGRLRHDILAEGTAAALHEGLRFAPETHWDNVRSRDAVETYNLKGWDEVQQLAGVDLGPWRGGAAPAHPGAVAQGGGF